MVMVACYFWGHFGRSWPWMSRPPFGLYVHLIRPGRMKQATLWRHYKPQRSSPVRWVFACSFPCISRSIAMLAIMEAWRLERWLFIYPNRDVVSAVEPLVSLCSFIFSSAGKLRSEPYSRAGFVSLHASACRSWLFLGYRGPPDAPLAALRLLLFGA